MLNEKIKQHKIKNAIDIYLNRKNIGRTCSCTIEVSFFNGSFEFNLSR